MEVFLLPHAYWLGINTACITQLGTRHQVTPMLQSAACHKHLQWSWLEVHSIPMLSLLLTPFSWWLQAILIHSANSLPAQHMSLSHQANLIPISLDLKWVSCPQHSVCRYLPMALLKHGIKHAIIYTNAAGLQHVPSLPICKH